MKWYNYLFLFLAGVFIANTIPHFINGISGNEFPTPFANPPGKGLSPPIVNLLWSFLNLAIGYFLLVKSKVNEAEKKNVWLAFIVGFVVISIFLSIGFTSKFK